VAGGYLDLMSYATSILFLPILPTRLFYLLCRYVFFVLVATHAYCTSNTLKHLSPWVIRVLFLSTDSLLPGNIPAYDARYCSLGNCSMLFPISAKIYAAPSFPTPGIVTKSSASSSSSQFFNCLSICASFFEIMV